MDLLLPGGWPRRVTVRLHGTGWISDSKSPNNSRQWTPAEKLDMTCENSSRQCQSRLTQQPSQNWPIRSQTWTTTRSSTLTELDSSIISAKKWIGNESSKIFTCFKMQPSGLTNYTSSIRNHRTSRTKPTRGLMTKE